MKEITEHPYCRFCKAFAAAIFEMTEGCICFPDDRVQALCLQHLDRATPLGEMNLILDFRVNYGQGRQQ